MKNGETGTLIHGTLLPEDLVPAFLHELGRLGCEDCGTMAEIEGRMGEDGWEEEEQTWWDLEWLFERLDEHAPEGHYFGSHPGDGSDFGFWPVEAE